MNEPIRSKTSTIDIYIKLAQYPILADSIRSRMREEIFRRGIISLADFEEEVKQKAIESQKREGVFDPFSREPANVWQDRKAKIRAYQTDFYFGFNLPTSIFEQIVQEVLENQGSSTAISELSFNPELAPWELLFRQGLKYESLPPPEREKISHHLEEIKAVLIKGMISDQLPYIGVARQIFDTADLRWIHQRRIGRGKIGGKAAGMLLAWKILQQQDPSYGPDISENTVIPESYFIGTEAIYDFRLKNNLDHLMNQKYRSLDEIRDEYPNIVEAHLKGEFPEIIVEKLRHVVEQLGKKPIIARSSSLLEDNFGFSFAGKYESIFCPNQGTTEENLEAILDAIRRIYASTLNPDAILYRQKHNLIDYDERMAILLQTVRGKQFGRYFLPSVAGVGFSENNVRWNPDIRREDGFLRVVWGLGTRAVDRVSNDYARVVALSHPKLRPETTAKAIRQYSQRYIDVIDIEENVFKTIPTSEILPYLYEADYPDFRYVMSIDRGDYVRNMVTVPDQDDIDDLIITFDYLTNDRVFIKLMRTSLMRLQQTYQRPVDIEFTVEIIPNYPQPSYRLHILQCRPLSQREMETNVKLPSNLDDNDILFTSHELVPDGKVDGIRYVIFANPKIYRQIPERATKLNLGRAIGRLNKILEKNKFIVMGPGRWGSANIDLGIRVTYADIFNTKALVEMAVASHEGVPSLSYGTHFYQDLVEANIHSLPLHLEDERSEFKWAFFQEAKNFLHRLSPQDANLEPFLKVIDMQEEKPGYRLSIAMDGSRDETVGYIMSGEWQDEAPDVKGTVSTF